MLTLRNALAQRTPSTLDTFLNQFFGDDFLRWPEVRWSFPLTAGTNIYEQDGQLVFEVELPGVKRQDIKVRLEDHTLFIGGQVRQDEGIKENQYWSQGRRYGRFERRFQLPEQAVVENKNINAKFEDGILKVSLPLKESLKAEAYDIKVD